MGLIGGGVASSSARFADDAADEGCAGAKDVAFRSLVDRRAVGVDIGATKETTAGSEENGRSEPGCG